MFQSLDGRLTKKLLQLYIDSLMPSFPLNLLTCLDLALSCKNLITVVTGSPFFWSFKIFKNT